MLIDGNDTAQADAVHTFVWEWRLGVSPERLWPCVSDTDRVNRLAGLPSVTYRTVPLEGGGSRVNAEIRLPGLIPLRYREHPFEWVEGARRRGFFIAGDFPRGDFRRGVQGNRGEFATAPVLARRGFVRPGLKTVNQRGRAALHFAESPSAAGLARRFSINRAAFFPSQFTRPTDHTAS